MEIKRDLYLKKLEASIGNGMVKIITGPRRCGKSYLLFEMFPKYLKEQGVKEDHILALQLDKRDKERYRDLDELQKYFDERKTSDGKTQFFLIDEIQLSYPKENPWVKGQKITFYDVLNQFLSYKNTEIFVTGSNSHLLSSDIATEFRGRGWQIPMHPLSFAEFSSANEGRGDDFSLWNRYYLYGGLPAIARTEDEEQERDYLRDVYLTTYLRDIVERFSLRGERSLDETVKVLASTVGSFVNPNRLSNTFVSKEGNKVSPATIARYLTYLEDAFLLHGASRFDIKGKEHIGSQKKYYFEDLGLRNAACDFTDHNQEPHSMENVIYNELILRGYQVSIGGVSEYSEGKSGKTERKNYEVDFVAERHGKRYYIQSVLYIPDEEKRKQEIRPLLLIRDSFKKILITKISGAGLYDENGILHLNLFRFLKDPDSLDI